MKHVKIVNYKDIGEVSYTKNFKAKNLSIRINGQGIIRVTIPKWCTYRYAEKYVLQKREWIAKKLKQIEQKREKVLTWKPGDIIPLVNKRIQIMQGENNDFYLKDNMKEFQVFVPQDYDSSDMQQMEFLMKIIGKVGYREGKNILPGILQDHASQLAIKYNRVTVRRMRSRWGSCSHANNISLNSALLFLEKELIDYVCIHELVHVLHKNHSKDFWDAMACVLPDYAERRKKLRAQAIIV